VYKGDTIELTIAENITDAYAVYVGEVAPNGTIFVAGYESSVRFLGA